MAIEEAGAEDELRKRAEELLPWSALRELPYIERQAEIAEIARMYPAPHGATVDG